MVEAVHQGNVFPFAILTLWLQIQPLRLNQSTKTTPSTVELACNYTFIHIGRASNRVFYSYAVCLHKPSARLYPNNVVEKQISSLNAFCLRRVRGLPGLVVWYFEELPTTWLANLAGQKSLLRGWLAFSSSRVVRAKEKH